MTALSMWYLPYLTIKIHFLAHGVSVITLTYIPVPYREGGGGTPPFGPYRVQKMSQAPRL